jgi:hypothetical protein
VPQFENSTPLSGAVGYFFLWTASTARERPIG